MWIFFSFSGEGNAPCSSVEEILESEEPTMSYFWVEKEWKILHFRIQFWWNHCCSVGGTWHLYSISFLYFWIFFKAQLHPLNLTEKPQRDRWICFPPIVYVESPQCDEGKVIYLQFLAFRVFIVLSSSWQSLLLQGRRNLAENLGFSRALTTSNGKENLQSIYAMHFALVVVLSTNGLCFALAPVLLKTLFATQEFGFASKVHS